MIIRMRCVPAISLDEAGAARSFFFSRLPGKFPSGNGAMTLLSDGVVEARNLKGELLGFERTCALSVKPAGEVADAAQAFGQDDDITVLTVSRSPACA